MRSVFSLDSREATFRIDYPDQARTGIEPISNFGQHFARAIVVRQHLARRATASNLLPYMPSVLWRFSPVERILNRWNR